MSQSVQLRKGVSSWHQQLALWLIANPAKTNAEAAKEFDVSPAWLSSVKHSDAFQDYFKTLQKEHAEAVLLGVKDKMLGTADIAVDEIARRIAAAPESIPFRDLLDTADVLAKRALPPAPSAAPAGNTTINVVTGISKEDLALARARMREGGSAPLRALTSAHGGAADVVDVGEESANP